MTASACASSDGTGDGNRSRLGATDDGGRGDGKAGGKKNGGKDGEGKSQVPDAVASGAPSEVTGDDTRASEFGGSDTPRTGIDPSLARASSHVDESQPDAKKEGVPSAYSEVLAASIEGLGENFRMTLTFSGDVPQQLPKDTYMIVSFGITARQEDQSFAFGANGDDKGWTAYAGGKGESRKFPGTFDINGNQIVMVVPWTSVEGPRSFEWFATSSWFRQIANTTSYSFDPVPNDGSHRFPD